MRPIVDLPEEYSPSSETEHGAKAAASAPNLRDVARVAGVSHQTVSRVINGRANIREETRQRVLSAIEQLNYRPNAVARALASGRTRRIGVLIESSSHYGPMNMLRGVEMAARNADYTVTTYTVRRAEPGEFERGVQYLLDQDVETLCILAPRQQSLESIRHHQLPMATVVIGSSQSAVDAAAGPGSIIAVHVDQYAGAAWAMQHLLDHGHRRIAHIAGPMDWVDARERSAAWSDALTEAGQSLPELIQGDWSADSGYSAARRIADMDGVTAVFAANDQMALGLIHGLHDLGISVPNDISVVGFDDIPESRHFLPPLTTVRQDFRRLGLLSVAATLNLLGEGEKPESQIVAPEPVLRSSVLPLP